jgi:threonyl-tRNA synthetase
MRVLIIHVDSFTCCITEKGRSKVLENFDEQNRVTAVGEALLVLTSVEKGDEVAAHEVADKAATSIEALARQLKVHTIVLHSFAHLFAELGSPTDALNIMKLTEAALQNIATKPPSWQIIRTPFGWFNTLDIKAKGHPLSKISRTFIP